MHTFFIIILKRIAYENKKSTIFSFNIVDMNGTPKGTRTPVAAVRGRSLNRLTMGANMAAELGFEPRHYESESYVLPLHHSAI